MFHVKILLFCMMSVHWHVVENAAPTSFRSQTQLIWNNVSALFAELLVDTAETGFASHETPTWPAFENRVKRTTLVFDLLPSPSHFSTSPRNVRGSFALNHVVWFSGTNALV